MKDSIDYLRAIDRKLRWAFIIFLAYIIGKSWTWLKLAWQWLMSLPIE